MARSRPSDRLVLWRQLAIGLALFGIYLLVDALRSPARRLSADRNGRHLYRFEQWLHIDVERSLNNWLAPRHLLSVLCNYEYAYTYLLSTLALFVWLYVRHPESFRLARNSFILLNLVAFACFLLYPVTPPRQLAGLGFVDTVSRGATVGSWGSGLVQDANQLAAMPSLHIGWALWVSAILARLTARRSVQLVSACHVLLTAFVIVSTANHYVLDAVASAVLVPACVAAAEWWYAEPSRADRLLPPADAFFLHVEDAGAPQHVGGVIVLEAVGSGDAPSLDRLRAVVRSEMANLPRFHQRVSQSRWRRPRWVDVDDVDVTRHVTERRSSTGIDGLHRIVAELAERRLPRDRPLWRIVLVRDIGPGQSAMVLLMHHAIADGIGTVVQALSLLRPRIELPAKSRDAPGRLLTAAATVAGLAKLATDGGPSRRLGAGSARRAFATADLDLAAVRRVATGRGVKVTDVVLGLAADAVATTQPELRERVRSCLRVAVPVMVREPGSGAEGNVTAAVMVDIPLDERLLVDRLEEIARRTTRLRSPSRAVASRFVMATGLRILPEPAMGWFARTVYGRRFFHAVVSNMPGPTQQLTLAAVPLKRVYPILPLAPGAPLALGALSWTGTLGVGLAGDPELVAADAFTAHMEHSLRMLDVLSAPLTTSMTRGSDGRPLEGQEEASA